MNHDDERDHAEEAANRAMVEEENKSETGTTPCWQCKGSGVIDMWTPTYSHVPGRCNVCQGARYVRRETAVLDPEAQRTNGDADYSFYHGGP